MLRNKLLRRGPILFLPEYSIQRFNATKYRTFNGIRSVRNVFSSVVNISHVFVTRISMHRKRKCLRLLQNKIIEACLEVLLNTIEHINARDTFSESLMIR